MVLFFSAGVRLGCEEIGGLVALRVFRGAYVQALQMWIPKILCFSTACIAKDLAQSEGSSEPYLFWYSSNV